MQFERFNRGGTVELTYKHNWDEARQRLEAFWGHEIIGRPCISVRAPERSPRPLPAPRDFETKWADPEYVAQSCDAAHEATYFGGEAMPGTSLMVGYCFSYGAPLHFGEQTVWQDPIIESWDEPLSLALAEEEWGWKRAREVVDRCLEVGQDRWMTGFPNFMQPNDHLPLLRGTEAFLIDLLERPGEVKLALRRLLDNWYAIYERLQARTSRVQEGSITWLSVWCPGQRHMTLQSDVSCMISPSMFEEFVAPELEEMTSWLDGSIYHLDGPDALQHLDRLLALDELRAIQWTPGTGQETGLAWLDLYKRIQAAGKAVVISLEYDEVETAVRELVPEELFILTGAPSPADAEALLERAAEITAKRA